MESQAVKHTVLDNISTGKAWYPNGQAKFRISNEIVHVRFCSADRFSSPRYKFNINPNTLSADYETWICGNADTYYLVPLTLIRHIYDDPDAYVDSRHPEIRVVSLNVLTNIVTYATNGKGADLTPYLRKTL